MVTHNSVIFLDIINTTFISIIMSNVTTVVNVNGMISQTGLGW